MSNFKTVFPLIRHGSNYFQIHTLAAQMTSLLNLYIDYSVRVHHVFIVLTKTCFSRLIRPLSDKDKGKAVPLQAWSGLEGFRKLRFPNYMTTAQDGGKVVSLTHRPPLPPENAPGTHFC
jgi:hypothetical protein